MIKVSVLYPNEDNKRFDHDYYKSSHIPLVAEKWGPHGLVRTEIDKGLAGGAPDAPAPFVALAHFYFENIEGFQKAFDEHGEAIMSDIPNYTDIEPQVQVSEVVD